VKRLKYHNSSFKFTYNTLKLNNLKKKKKKKNKREGVTEQTDSVQNIKGQSVQICHQSSKTPSMAITTEEEDQKLKRSTSANLCKYAIRAQKPHQWRSQLKRQTKNRKGQPVPTYANLPSLLKNPINGDHNRRGRPKTEKAN
jgi:hypothetical protein